MTEATWLLNLSTNDFMSTSPATLPTTTTEPYDNDNGCPQINCTTLEYMQYILGPQTLPLHKAVMVSIIFGAIFITGVLGNFLVCMVIIRHSAMHTATNYYLFSLAVSDLIYLLLGLPAEIFLYWHQYPYLFGLPFCKLRAFISEACTYVSVFTIVAFSMERFLAICHPLHLYTMSGLERAVKIITALWIVSFLSAIPFGVKTKIQYLDYPIDGSKIQDSAVCSIDLDFPEKFPLFELSFCIFFIIPMILIILLYGRMGSKIRARATEVLGVQQGSRNREARNSQKKKKAVIRMLAAVVITFFVWGFSYYVTCTINPIVYNVMSRRYRVAFKEILCGKKVGAFYNSGFARDQSSFVKDQRSFRHSSIATTSLGADTQYSRVHSNTVVDFPVLNTTNIVIVLANNSTRSARLMRFLSDPASNFNHNRRVGPGSGPLPGRVRASVEGMRPPTAWRPPLPPPGLGGSQLIRREFNGNWPAGGLNQATRFAHSKDAAVLDVGKNQFYRPKDIQQYNQQSVQYIQNFKASPHFKGSELNKYPIYSPIQQHAIPVEASKYVAFKQGQGQGQGQRQDLGQSLHQNTQFGQTSNSYAVYEDTENGAKTAASFGQNYQQNAAPAAPQKLTKAAEDYLHFMSTNEYFLPRHEPNYKQLDVERDQVKYQQQQLVQKEPQPQQQQQLHQLQPQRQLTDTSVSSSYNKPLRVADLFYQQDPAPSNSNSNSNSAIVRGSYQAGQNAFVVKSDGNKSVKHILSSKPPQAQTQSPPLSAYTKSWHNSGPKTETPEPLRFEFTEHDAIRGSASYTNAPQGHKFYYETHPSTPHVSSVSVAPLPENLKPVQEATVSTKDNTDYAKNIQQQQSLEPAIVAAESAEIAKDNEAYCEKICANVYDENDEIVCGSDGYMYTGESQLECYSSCLNIEVSIKSKGSCA
ncbi:hypothetical protein ACLKA7_015046 [Drosophila subpalustris]